MHYLLDGDPGHDDMLTIFLAAKHLDVVGFTTVSGNQSLEKTTINARKAVELAGLTDLPIAKGSRARSSTSLATRPRSTGRAASTASTSRTRRCRSRRSTPSTSSSRRATVRRPLAHPHRAVDEHRGGPDQGPDPH